MHEDILKKWLDSFCLITNNQSYLNQIYKDFLKNPNSVDSNWHNFFQQLCYEKKSKNQSINLLKPGNISWIQSNQNLKSSAFLKDSNINDHEKILFMKIFQLVNSFRVYGHQYSKLDPLNLYQTKLKNNFLEIEHYEFLEQDLQKIFNTKLFGINQGLMTLKKIYQFLKKTYCSSIGIEYMHILDIDQVLWIQNIFESTITTSKFNNLDQKQFLKEIIAAETLENYLGKKFPGMKRFSLEGSDVLIPMLKELIRYSSIKFNTQEIFFGMAHRGRLNVLINILGKDPKDLFDEFLNKNPVLNNSGDVKYHQGLYSNMVINKDTIYVSLLPNPSHLEIITPVIMGASRSRIDQLSYDCSLTTNNQNLNNIILPVVIHGDASISAQGIVQESFNMSNTRAYNVWGTIHIVINNQIGFTTSNIHDMRSTPYCTDIAKMIQAPIIHVNADDVNAVIFVIRFALDFRNRFKHDIIIDLVCYRRHGHNETDEPSVTQPIMYQKIRTHPTVSSIYSNILMKSEILNINDVKNMINSYQTKLETKPCLLQKWQPVHTSSMYPSNRSYNDVTIHHNINKINDTIVIDNQYLQNLAYRISDIPSSIIMHDRVKKIYHNRIDMALGKRLFDWGGAETLAYATLLDQGYSIRLSGEDVARGTFFHRHAVIYDQNSEIQYIPLMHIKKKQGSFLIWDSVLSEESTLAFEYGYSSITKNNMLVIWEAQFGDFSNGAQIVIDQFISSGEQKWNNVCGLIMLLPHGYEGQGPEHSSCRLERYLQLCSENNIRICSLSTPAQMYHILRQQAQNNSNIKKPLIIISPKSLLRHPLATSSLNELAQGTFKTIFNEINDQCIINKINKVIICTGKIYYDLIHQRNQTKQYQIAIIRIEQLYPFPYEDIQSILKLYNHVMNFVWCQEEPKNQGSWYYIQRSFCNNFPNIQLNYIGRPDSSAPATGYFSVHQQQQTILINDALDLNA